MTEINRRAVLYTGVAALLAAMGAPASAEETSPGGALPSLDLLARDPNISDLALSPDGRRLALLSQKNGEKILFDYNLVDGTEKHTAITQETEKRLKIPNTKIRSIFWVSNRHIAVVKSFTTGSADAELYLTNVADLNTATFVSFNTGASPERIRVGDHYEMVFSTAQILTRFDPATGKSNQIAYDFNAFDWVITPEGEPVAYSEVVFGTGDFRINMRDGKGWKTVFSANYKDREKGTYKRSPRLICLGREGQSVIARFPFSDDDDEDTAGTIEIQPDGTRSEPFVQKGRSGFVLVHPQTNRFAGFAYREDWIRYEYTDPLLKKLTENAAKAMPGYRVRIVDMAREDPKKMLLYVEGDEDAGTYFFIDFGTGNFKEVGKCYPTFPTDRIAHKSKISYAAADGLSIDAFLTLPPGIKAKALPLILLPHGGPQSRDDLGFDWIAATLATRGYAVLQPNFRGSSGYGHGFVEKAYGEWGKKMQTDLSDGLRYLATQGIVDSKRVAIMGASYGGYAALAGVAFEPEVFTCAVGISGVYDLPAMMKSTAIADGRKSFSYRYWDKFFGKADIAGLSPVNQADKIKAPVLLIHGLDDTVVPFSQSTRMESALKGAGKTVEFVRLKGEDHWMSVESTRISMINAAVAFLGKHNPA